MTSQRTRNAGFTLVELLIVVLIIGILAAVAIPVFNGQRQKAKRTALQTSLRTAMAASRSHYAANNSYLGLETLAGNAAQNEALNKEEASIKLEALNNSTDVAGPSSDPTKLYAYVFDSGETFVVCGQDKAGRTACTGDSAVQPNVMSLAGFAFLQAFGWTDDPNRHVDDIVLDSGGFQTTTDKGVRVSKSWQCPNPVSPGGGLQIKFCT